MRKIIVAICLFLGLFVVGGLVVGVTPVKAWLNCTEWDCSFVDAAGNPMCKCTGGTAGDCTPTPGNYCCNENDGTCDVGGGPSCFVPGTKVEMVGAASKKIEDVKIGDRVKTFADDKILESTVINTLKSRRDFYYELTAEDTGDRKGRPYNVKVAAEHRFYIGGGNFEEVQYLKVGDSVYVDQDNALVAKTVTAKTRIDQPTDVYNLTIDKTHTYFANDFAVAIEDFG